MATSVCLALAHSAQLAGPRVNFAAATAHTSQPRRSRAVVSCAAKRNDGQKYSALLAASVAAATASVLLPLDPTLLTLSSSLAASAPVEIMVASDLLSQVALTGEKAPALGLLADDSAELTPAERARQLAAEYKRKREEEAAARAAAAAAAAEEAAKAAEAEAAAKAQAARSTSFFGSKVEEKSPPVQQQVQPKEETKVVKKSKRGGLPLFVSQLGILAAFSGVIAAAFLVPDSEWKKVEAKGQELGEKLAPVLEDALVKAKPVLQQAKEKGQEFLEEAKPYVAKAIETAKPVVAEAVEKAKPLMAQAGEAVVAQVSSVLAKKDEEKPASTSNGSPKASAEEKAPVSSQTEAKL